MKAIEKLPSFNLSKPIGAPLPLNLEDSVNVAIDADRKSSEKSPIEYLSPIKPSNTPRHITFAPTVTSKIENVEHDSVYSQSKLSPVIDSSIYPKLPPASDDLSRDPTRILSECGNLIDKDTAKKVDEEKRRSSMDIFESSLKVEPATVGPDGKCYVDGFTVGRRDYGSVFWPGYVDLTNLNIDSLVHFRHKEITVYPDDTTKPAIGEGLNRTAEVTLERVWPNDKNTHMPIKDVQRLDTMRFREKLERASTKMGAQFIDYRPDSGSWVFKVSHFSKYGLLDDNGENELPMDTTVNVSPHDLTYDKVQRQKINIESQNVDFLEKSNVGLGGYSFPALDVDYAELSDTEPSILVKSDLSVEDNERLSHLKHQLFYEASLTKDESGRKIDDYLDIPKSQLKKQCLINDLYERSIQLLDSKFDVSHIDSKIMAPIGKLADLSASSLSSAVTTRLPTLHLIPPKNTLKMLPFETSLLKNLTQFYADSGAYSGRRFRIGWTGNSKFLRVAYTKEIDKQIQSRASLFNTAPELGRESLFSEISLIQMTSNDDIRTNLIELLLDVQLLNSVRYNRNGCPCFVPTNGVESIDRYLKLINSSEWGEFPCQDKNYFADVIKLCVAFWGRIGQNSNEQKDVRQYALEMSRKENLMDWLTHASKTAYADKLLNSQGLKGVLTFITMGDLEQAAEYAFKLGDFRLALSITQLCGSEAVRSLYKQQLSQWYQSQADRHIDIDRLKVYLLLSGLLQWKTSANIDINPFENLTWQQSLSLSLRYCTPSICSIADCVKLYDSTWSELGNGLSIEPKAEYCKRALSSSQKSGTADFNSTLSVIERKRLKNDVRYHLIKLFCERSYRLESVLNNATWTSDALSFYLSWHLWCILSAAGYTSLPEHTKNSLHIQYACQLERCGLWPWSIFVVMHISGDLDREKAVKHFLSTYAHSANEDLRNFLRNDLSIPEQWLTDAKSSKDLAKISNRSCSTIS
uniref:Nuclear pore complex protein Nup98-Nup96 n=1 Tax=Romanomermis culicivorax TaxID=13658 RepID=A0A915HLZ1_ROMCU